MAKLEGIIYSAFRNYIVLRGFAPIMSLARISKKPASYQRDANNQHKIDIVKYLVSKGVDPAMTYTNGYSYSGKRYSLLNAAVGNKTTEIAEYLIEQGADINTQTDSVSDLPLIFVALRAENIELLKLLIEKGADTSVVDKDGKTIFDLAKEQGYDEIAALEK